MKFTSTTLLARLAVAAAFLLVVTAQALGHCDTMNGPVVKAARAALETRNVNLVLIWVQPGNEREVKQAFDQTLAVRKLNRAARDLADKYFFETVVRIHRAGEGEAYTGLKPAGAPIEPGFELADQALETGSLDPLLKIVPAKLQPELRKRFTATVTLKNFNQNNVEAGRQYVAAYVSFLHFVEELYEGKA